MRRGCAPRRARPLATAKKGLKIAEVPIHIRRRELGVSRKGTDFVYGLLFLKTMPRTWWR
jgi:hypothetical protein